MVYIIVSNSDVFHPIGVLVRLEINARGTGSFFLAGCHKTVTLKYYVPTVDEGEVLRRDPREQTVDDLYILRPVSKKRTTTNRDSDRSGAIYPDMINRAIGTVSKRNRLRRRVEAGICAFDLHIADDEIGIKGANPGFNSAPQAVS